MGHGKPGGSPNTYSPLSFAIIGEAAAEQSTVYPNQFVPEKTGDKCGLLSLRDNTREPEHEHIRSPGPGLRTYSSSAELRPVPDSDLVRLRTVRGLLRLR